MLLAAGADKIIPRDDGKLPIDAFCAWSPGELRDRGEPRVQGREDRDADLRRAKIRALQRIC